MSSNAMPIIKPINPNNNDGLIEVENELENSKTEKKIIMDYPTVYIHNWKKDSKYEVYVGETNDIIRRTKEHYLYINDSKKWEKNLNNTNSIAYIIGHPKFNKSLTLDIENRLMHYLSAVNNIKKVYNGRENPQNDYYTKNDFNDIFNKIWKKLHKENPDVFVSQSEIIDSAIYKASPLHKLKEEQLEFKRDIVIKITGLLESRQQNQLMLIEGSAGTGKTVLLSSIFYDFCNKVYHEEGEESVVEDLDCAIVVNHEEQLKVYNQIVDKLFNTKGQKVFTASKLLNQYIGKNKKTKKYDVIFVDEAHLLFTRHTRSYSTNFDERGQLYELIKHAKVVVAVFDPDQVLNTEQYVDLEMLEDIRTKAAQRVILTDQLRMQCGKNVIKWIYDITKNKKIGELSNTGSKYEIRIFDDPITMEKEIKKKANNDKTKLSRIIATYDWPYKPNEDVIIKDDKTGKIIWRKPWNYEKIDKKSYDVSWAENPKTIDEVGSIYTIQGSDLNYAGVIIGRSVSFYDGQIQFNPDNSYNKRAKINRTTRDGKKIKLGELFLSNELNVLLTRGVNGLYIYADDPKLRNELKKQVKRG